MCVKKNIHWKLIITLEHFSVTFSIQWFWKIAQVLYIPRAS